jgi:hypothetical protein
MSAVQQAKAKRRQMRNGYAHLGGALRRPHVSGMSYRSVAESIAAARHAAAREAKSKVKKKK